MKNLKNVFAALLNDESGQDLIEYALVAGLIGLGAVLAMTTLSGKIGVISKNLTSMPDRFLDTVQINLNRRAGKTLANLLKELQDLHTSVKRCIKFCEAATKAVKKLKDADSWAGVTETAGGLTSKGVAVFALINFIVECADHGTSILKLLPI